ncbi:hypothetical protein CR513_32522, partial [Mucuna pruriens]
MVDNLRLENQLIELTSLVRHLVVGQHQPSIATRVCGICTFVEHPTDIRPTLQETESDHPESVRPIGQYSAQKFESAESVPQSQTVATIESAIIGQLTIFRGPDEAVGDEQPGVSTDYKLQQH